MDSLVYLEILAIGVIITAQFLSFRKTRAKISELENAIPESDILAVSSIEIPIDELKARSPEELLARRHFYTPGDVGVATGESTDDLDEEDEAQVDLGQAISDDESFDLDEDTDEDDWDSDDEDEIEEAVTAEPEQQTKSEVPTTTMAFTIVEGPSGLSRSFTRTLAAINTYILSNRTGTADFSLIKDITERNTDAIEEEINLSVSTPLFLGLMGTMAGIVIGILRFALYSPQGDANQDGNSGTLPLITSVALAMIASFFGLLLTTINSGWFQKAAKARMDRLKGEFYTFLQTTLLPVIDQGLAATLHSLQVNLADFNQEFRVNLDGMNRLFGKFADGLGYYKDLIEALENMDVKKVASYNLEVLTQFDKSLDAINRFREHLEIVNIGVEKSSVLIDRFDRILARTDDVSMIAQKIEGTVSDGRELIAYLTAHKETLEQFEENTRGAIAETGAGISDVFKELERHIASSIGQLKEFTADEAAILKDAMAEGRLNLANLSFLENINDLLREIRQQAERPVTSAVEAKLDNLARSLQETNLAIAKVVAGVNRKTFFNRLVGGGNDEK